MRALATALTLVLCLLAASGQAAWITVSGNVTADTTWSGPDTVFVSTGDVLNRVYVTSSATLTIDPGTVVLFDVAGSIYAYGMLMAVGTEGDPILFSSAADTVGGSPAPGDWITVAGYLTGGLQMEHCIVRYSTDGITMDEVGGQIHRCLIEDFSSRGLNLQGPNVAPFPVITITDSRVHRTVGTGTTDGLYAYNNMFLTVSGCHFDSCLYGFDAVGCRYGAPTFEVFQCQFSHNANYGVYLRTGG